MNIKDKIVVITGSSEGLGKELAKLFVSYGSRVIINSRDKNKLAPVAQEIKAFPIAADISKESDVKDLAQQVIKKYGTIDIWVNNAGIWYKHGLVQELDMKIVHAMFELNVFGTMYGCREALSSMLPRKKGMIINILSVSALSGRPGSSSYCASKFAADGFTKSLREEVRNDNIHVLSVYPGGMKTRFFDQKRPADYNQFMDMTEVAKKIMNNILSDHPEEEQVIRRQK